MPWTDDDFDALCRYAVTLERAISIVASALREGDAGYARRVLDVMEKRIRANAAAAEGEHATKH